MISRWQWILLRLARAMWVRVTLFSLAGIVTALVGIGLARYVPQEIAESIGSDSIDNILDILASSMLAVTTFSLATMVSAYGAVTNNVTPRAAKLLRDDTTAHNALGTFIGSFLFSLVGIVALSTGAYGQRGRVILFVATLVVIILIVVTMLRWIDYLSRLGRVGETIDLVEKATKRALVERLDYPALGGAVLESNDDIPEGARPVFATDIGYVQHIDMKALADFAGDERDVFVTSQPGSFADRMRPLARIIGPTDDEGLDQVRAAFSVGDDRSFDQDPRFGLCVLAEVASRALSPAMNDAGTAIDVLGRAERLLSEWSEGRRKGEAEDVNWPRVRVPPIRPDDVLDDVVAPIARDGAGIVEVQIRLLKVLRVLATTGDPELAAAARKHALLALARAEKALEMDEDKTRLRNLAEGFVDQAGQAR